MARYAIQQNGYRRIFSIGCQHYLLLMLAADAEDASAAASLDKQFKTFLDFYFSMMMFVCLEWCSVFQGLHRKKITEQLENLANKKGHKKAWFG